jgi:hypothetical protein
MALGLTQPLIEMSTRCISWGKGGQCVALTTLPPSCAKCLEIVESQPSGTLGACSETCRDCFTFILFIHILTKCTEGNETCKCNPVISTASKHVFPEDGLG